jgi:hypothetical protein
MNAVIYDIQMWLMTALCCVVFVVAAQPTDALARSCGTDAVAACGKLAFLSEHHDEVTQPPEETPRPTPENNTNFDGAWTFTSAGCRYTGSLPAKIIAAS